MLVTITKEHCKDGNYGSVTDCPLARALGALGFLGVVVGPLDISISGKEHFFDSGLHSPNLCGGWNSIRMKEIQLGVIESYKLDIPSLNQ